MRAVLSSLAFVGRASVRVVRTWPRGDPDERAAYLPAAWVAALAGGLAGAALFGGSPLAAIFWLTRGRRRRAVARAAARRRTGMSLSIVHVIARLNVGGAALHVLQLAHEQSRRGHDVVVVAGTLAAGEESMEYVAEELGVDVLRLPVLQRELSLRADPAAILALRRIIRQRRPDVLHTHTAKAGATGRLAAMSAGRARPRAIVHTYHGHVLSGYFSRRWERIFRSIERALALTSGTLIAVSDEVRDDLVGFGVAPAQRFVVVPYGFDLPPWGEADERGAAGDPRRDRRRRGRRSSSAGPAA